MISSSVSEASSAPFSAPFALSLSAITAPAPAQGHAPTPPGCAELDEASRLVAEHVLYIACSQCCEAPASKATRAPAHARTRARDRTAHQPARARMLRVLAPLSGPPLSCPGQLPRAAALESVAKDLSALSGRGAGARERARRLRDASSSVCEGYRRLLLRISTYRPLGASRVGARP